MFSKGNHRRLAVLFLLFLINTAYIAAFATASIFYMTNVLLHVFGGMALAGAGVWLMVRHRDRLEALAIPAGLLGVATLTGLFLTWYGAIRPNQAILVAHIAVGAAGVFALLGIGSPAWRRTLAGTLSVCVVLGLAAYAYRKAEPLGQARVLNRTHGIPTSMEEEGAGPESRFWPSSANTSVNGTIPSDFFMDSKLCAECHPDIYEQWNSSMHHFASFNNQFYRRSIEQMQELSGTRGSKWCAGCHDHAVFFNGRFDKPIKDQMDTPEAQNGLGCLSCHSISHVEGSMGNGGFIINYPPLHHLASSRNKYIRQFDRFVTYLDPEPHRKTFLKPFMQNSSEFCSTCHKVHLDVPVNNYRWLRGFNDYDNWQASGVSGQGARSFYYPPKSSTCADCHMPLVPSRDLGNRDGVVHNHRFATANTAVAYVNRDEKQLKDTVEFLQSGFISVDIFAASPVTEDSRELPMMRRAGSEPRLMSTFAVGEESEQTGGEFFLREVGQIAAPIDRAGVRFRPGSTVRLDVVVRTRKIGHFFPGGTVDAFDVWLELEARDSTGRKIFHSGAVEDGGSGPVEKGAHFYRSYMLDANGNMINKRNAWQARSVLYVRLIPPGAADTAHFRLRIPPDAKGPITVDAKLNYRKFAHFYTQYAYAGQPDANQRDRAAIDHDSRDYTFLPANIPSNVSGKIKDRIPDIPIVTMASAKATLPLGAPGEETIWKPVIEKRDRERWNDWGIGLLLQGDLKGAEYAFRRVTEAEPEYADGWLNVARALIQEGQTEAAKPFVGQAGKINANLGRVHFFKAMIEKADGDYDAALASLRRTAQLYPRDRVVLNQMGRVLFLKREYGAAVETLRRVLEVDPEDLQAHYTLMLAYRGMGRADDAAREEKLFRRFKADEASQTITAKPRLLSPEDNNERQQIHDHESIPLS
jgi:tetratricopeptide (TPR) repeat protein